MSELEGHFGVLDDGRGVRSVRIGTPPGPVLDVLDLGATVQRLEVTCADGVRRDVGLGYATAQEYVDRPHYLGAVVGRYANRIAGGRFDLDGRAVQLAANDRGNHLHGGPDGFDRRTWDLVEHGPDHVLLGLVSPDGDQGFPGTVSATARYSVTGDEVVLVLSVVTDAPTVVNLTSHVYLALPDPVLQVPADGYLPVGASGLPLGPVEPVDGTPFDLRTGARLADVVRSAHPQVAQAGGLDHTLVVGGAGMRRVATLASSVLAVEVGSDQAGLQVYTGNAFDGTDRRSDGARIDRHAAVALEPQRFPDSPNQPAYPSSVLRPGEEYRHEIRWRFTAPGPEEVG